MREIKTHIVNPTNDGIRLDAVDEPGPGGACHLYSAVYTRRDGSTITELIGFQNGPIAEHGINGITHEVLLAIVIDRLEGFQSGPYACESNQRAIEYVQAAMSALRQRTLDRMSRGVEGTSQK